QGGVAQALDALAAEGDLTLALRRAGQQTHDRPGQHGLAAAGLADQAERASSVERERHAVDGPYHAPGRVEVGLEVDDVEQVGARCGEVVGAGVDVAAALGHSALSRTSNRARTTSPR